MKVKEQAIFFVNVFKTINFMKAQESNAYLKIVYVYPICFFADRLHWKQLRKTFASLDEDCAFGLKLYTHGF